jgi:hypothetical protein
MVKRLIVSVPPRQVEIQQIAYVTILVQPKSKVIRLYVSMYEVPAMEVLQSVYHLVGEQENCLQRKFGPA